MPLKLVHCADFHIGAPCRGFSAELSSVRNEEIRHALTTVADFCREKAVDALLICGDLFDSPTPLKSDCEFVRDTLSSLSPIDVFIVLGNHDYMCAHSPFADESFFSENVHIFPCCEHSFVLSEKNAAFWGKSCSSNFIYPAFSSVSPDPSLINVFCLHGDTVPGSGYNIISKDVLSSISCDYAAFGHIHNGEIFTVGKTKCAYCGTPEGHKFSDDGTTGFIYAEISKEKTSLSQICLTKRKYRNITLDISGKTLDEIIIAAKDKLNMTDFFKLNLVGENITEKELLTHHVKEAVENSCLYIEITDSSFPGYDFDAIEKEESLRGAFLRDLRERTHSEEEFLGAAKLGLDALCGRILDFGGDL